MHAKLAMKMINMLPRDLLKLPLIKVRNRIFKWLIKRSLYSLNELFSLPSEEFLTLQLHGNLPVHMRKILLTLDYFIFYIIYILCLFITNLFIFIDCMYISQILRSMIKSQISHLHVNIS
jgi:hypothetical protein